jgi:RNA polymerase sigma-32 factor
MVRLGTTSAQRKLFFKLRRAKTMIQAIEGGDLSPAQVTRIAELLDVLADEVVSMNERLTGPDRPLNTPVEEDGDGE